MQNFTSLRHLLGSYLHQDFDAEFATSADAIRAFAEGEPTIFVQAAANEIDVLLLDPVFQSSPSTTLVQLGCEYDPRSEGKSVIEWLQSVQRELRTFGLRKV